MGFTERFDAESERAIRAARCQVAQIDKNSHRLVVALGQLGGHESIDLESLPTRLGPTKLRSCRSLAAMASRPNSDLIVVWSAMERSLAVPIRELAFSDHKMALVSGPRQRRDERALRGAPGRRIAAFRLPLA